MNRRGEREKAERLQRLMSILDSKPELKQPIVLSENKSTTTDGFIPSQNTLTYHYSEDGIHLDRRCGISAVSSNHGKSVEGLYYLPDSRKFMTLKDTGCGMEISEAVVEDITIKEIDFLLSSVEARR